MCYLSRAHFYSLDPPTSATEEEFKYEQNLRNERAKIKKILPNLEKSGGEWRKGTIFKGAILYLPTQE